MITIRCSTRFDITPTGVLGQYRENREVLDQARGDVIRDRAAWLRARNQQRNWDTMNQIIALRCLPERIQAPRRMGEMWQFEFDVPDLAAVSAQPGDLEFLRRDAHGVPMILGLDEAPDLDSMIHALGPRTNTDFHVLADKYRTGERNDV